MNAIILAGGHSTRMKTQFQSSPKPLLPVLGIPNIERTVLMLNDFGITDITIISGAYSEYYRYLQAKYSCSLITDTNTSISTLYGISTVINKIGDTFVIEGDVVLAENVFTYKPYNFYYTIRYPECEPDSWCPVTDSSGQILKFNIGKFAEPCVFGISFWCMNDKKLIRAVFKKICTLENIKRIDKFWDDYLVDFLDELPIYTLEIPFDAAAEMNTKQEYLNALQMSKLYYSSPYRYFINLQTFLPEQIFFYQDYEKAVIYTMKLWEDYNKKHPNTPQDMSTPINFGENEYPFIVKHGVSDIGHIDLVFEDSYIFIRRLYINASYRNKYLGTNVVKKYWFLLVSHKKRFASMPMMNMLGNFTKSLDFE